MEVSEQINYWISTAELDLKAAGHLFEKGDYSWCLFICHLLLEKTFKAFYVRDNKKTPPRTHDLVKLAEFTTVSLTEVQKDFLFMVNTFNIEARYPDYKQQFYKICDKEFTAENFGKVKELYSWLKSQIKR